MTVKLSLPLSGKMTDPYGYRGAVVGAAGQLIVNAQLHTGQDIAAPLGTQVRAANAGTVRTWWDAFPDGTPAGGNMVAVVGDGFETRYAHLNEYAVSAGDYVNAGDLVGYVGATGAATGEHLHFELLIGGTYVDPLPYLTDQTLDPPVIERNTNMHAVRQIGLPDSGVIVGGGQPPRARMAQVFEAECAALNIKPIDCPDWMYGTLVREAWTDFNTSVGYIRDAVNGILPESGVAPLGLSDSDAQKIAIAVADEQAKRLKS